MSLMPVGFVPEWDLSDRLRKSRECAQLSQVELAKQTGMSRASVSNYETGLTQPRRPQIVVWALATGVSLDWLLTGTSDSGGGPGEVRRQGLEPRTRWLSAIDGNLAHAA